MDLQRRNFLRGYVAVKHTDLLPPWIRETNGFYYDCTRCGDCITACPEGILQTNQDGFPQPDFTKGGCTFCGDCARACNEAVYHHDLNKQPWQQIIHIEPTCLTYQGITCQSCQDTCEHQAIRFEYAIGRTPHPIVNTETCTGCGMCVQVCPASALTMKSHKELKQEDDTTYS